jgi:hypothetical protein
MSLFSRGHCCQINHFPLTRNTQQIPLACGSNAKRDTQIQQNDCNEFLVLFLLLRQFGCTLHCPASRYYWLNYLSSLAILWSKSSQLMSVVLIFTRFLIFLILPLILSGYEVEVSRFSSCVQNSALWSKIRHTITSLRSSYDATSALFLAVSVLRSYGLILAWSI